MNEIIKNTEQTNVEFSNVHKEILFCAQSSRNYAFRMALALKRMRDEKLYLAANFATFGDYTAEELGIKERQAYNYIEIAEKHGEEFLQLNSKLGITKLLLLSDVEEPEKKTELAKAAETKTVAELKEEIKKITERNKALEATNAQQTDRAVKAENEKAKIEAELKKVKSAPVQKVVEKTVEKVVDPQMQARITQLEKELTTKDNEISTLNKKLAIEADTVMATFKLKFDDLQNDCIAITELLSKTDDEKGGKCRRALSALIKKFTEDWKI